MKKSYEERYNKYIGCHAFIDMSDGFLVISVKGRALSLSQNIVSPTHGMFIGIRKSPGGSEYGIVTFNGMSEFMYEPEYIKVIGLTHEKET